MLSYICWVIGFLLTCQRYESNQIFFGCWVIGMLSYRASTVYIFIYKVNSRFQPISKILVLYLTILLVFYRQLSHITKLLNYQLRSLFFIRHSISISTTTIIDSAYILPLFEYQNVILYNIPLSYIIKLQILQNYLARCIFKIPK